MSIKKSFITGLVLTLPLAVTVWCVCALLNFIGEPASKIIFGWLDIKNIDNTVITVILSFFSILVVLSLIVLIGWISNLFLGRLIITFAEKIINHIPFIKTVYNTVKQIIETFGQNSDQVFSKTVLIEYPRKNCYAIGFLTSETEGELQEKTGQFVVNVFLPTTPNPSSGFLLMIPKEDVTVLEMSVADGMKMIISGGVVVPPYKQKKG